MKRNLLSMTLMMTLAGASFAQTPLVRVAVPFEFVAGGKTFPAGQYSLRPGSDLKSVLLTTSYEWNAASLMTLDAGRLGRPSKTEVVFYRYGHVFFLRRVSVAGLRASAELPPTHAESLHQLHGGAPEEIRLGER